MYPPNVNNELIRPHFAQDYDYDDDYDVYLFWPSLGPDALVPVNADYFDEPSPPLSPTVFESDTEDELDKLDLEACNSLTLSPTFSFNSDFIFPEDQGSTDGMRMNGYSRVFRMGLVSKSRQLSRQLDGIFKSAWQAFASSFRKLKHSRSTKHVDRRSHTLGH